MSKNIICDESKMCFATVANETYQQYISWWLYFLDHAYPKSHKMVFLDGHINQSTEKELSVLSGNFDIKENAFDGYNNVCGRTIQCLRWLIFDPIFESFDCLSMGDVDMAICKESPSYMKQHLSHCELLNIPYSNCIRANSNPKRMGGIHVVKPKEWFKIMKPVIDKYRSEFRDGVPRHKVLEMDVCFNELFILSMILESDLGELPINLSSTYWSSLTTSAHHGVHIRLAEIGIDRIRKSKGYSSRKSEFLDACKTQLFDKLAVKSPKIGSILRQVMKSYDV